MSGPDRGVPTTVYVPRRIQHLGVRAFDGLRVKTYLIERRGHDADPRIVDAALAYAEATLPAQVRAEGDDHGLGFVILHAGAHAHWLLLDWWAHGEICCQHLARAPIDGGTFGPCPAPYTACVWEGVVVSHEHRAWVGTMLTPTPDPEAYLRDALPDGWH